MNINIYNLIKSYTDKGISVIPCKAMFDEKEQITYGKYPAISGWHKYCEEMPEDEEIREWSGIPRFTGLAIATGYASNICCIDVDTTNKSLIKRIEEILPYTPCVIMGAEGRGGKYLFRLYDFDSDYVKPAQGKYKVKNGAETVCDILMDSSYLVAPPSLHSRTMDGETRLYKWKDGNDLLKIGVDNLPLIDSERSLDKTIELINMAVKGIKPADMSLNMPLGAIDLSDTKSTKELLGHRHEDMVSFVHALIAKRYSIETAVKELVERDRLRNNENPYFLDKTKGHNTEDRTYNAMMFYFKNLMATNRGRVKSSELEIPSLSIAQEIYLPSSEWGPIDIDYKIQELPAFDYNWIKNYKIREYIKTGSEVNSISPQNIYFMMLGGFSSLIGNKVKILPYRHNKSYVETFGLYIGNVAHSGGRKSETSKIALTPLRKLDKWVKEENKKNLAKAQQIKKDIDYIIKKKENDRIKDMQDVGSSDSAFAKQCLEEIEELKKTIPVHREISLYEQQTTIQRMYEIAEQNSSGIFIEIGEFGTKWNDLKAQGSEKERDFYLKGWDGHTQFSNKTKHQGENIIDELSISMGFSAQFDIMENIIDDIKTKRALNDGLLQRFLVFCSDIERITFVDRHFEQCLELDNIFSNAYYIEKTDKKLMFSDGAYKLWEKFSDILADKIVKEDDGAISTALSKYSGLVIRLAANLETFNNNGKIPKEITEDSFKTAWEIINYAERHMRYLFDLRKKRLFKSMVDMLKTSVIEDETTVTSFFRGNYKLFGGDITNAKKALEEMAVRNIIKLIKDGKGYRIKINPAIARC